MRRLRASCAARSPGPMLLASLAVRRSVGRRCRLPRNASVPRGRLPHTTAASFGSCRRRRTEAWQPLRSSTHRQAKREHLPAAPTDAQPIRPAPKRSGQSGLPVVKSRHESCSLDESKNRLSATNLSGFQGVGVYLTLRDLFSLKVDVVFYDLTSTYFEGHGPAGLAAHGYSRDGKPREPQVLVGLVLVDGWPIAHHVFAGNWRDMRTVPGVVDDLESRFGLRRVVFVGDRGMVTSQNLERLRRSGHGYVVGRNRRRSEEVYEYIQRARGPWIECP